MNFSLRESYPRDLLQVVGKNIEDRFVRLNYSQLLSSPFFSGLLDHRHYAFQIRDSGVYVLNTNSVINVTRIT